MKKISTRAEACQSLFPKFLNSRWYPRLIFAAGNPGTARLGYPEYVLQRYGDPYELVRN
jgi:hypothetical protein